MNPRAGTLCFLRRAHSRVGRILRPFQAMGSMAGRPLRGRDLYIELRYSARAMKYKDYYKSYPDSGDGKSRKRDHEEVKA